MTHLRIAFLLLTAAACSGEPAKPTPDHEIVEGTGSRLRPQRVGSIDGSAKRFLQIFDTQIQQPCRLTNRRIDQKASCIPLAHGTIVFLDEACTTPYVATEYGDEAVIVAGSVNSDAVRVGARVTNPPAARYMNGGRVNCVATGFATDVPLYEIAEFLSADIFAEGKLDRVQLSDDLEAIVFNGDDNSSVLYDLVDRTSGANCTPAMTEAGVRCQAEIGSAINNGLLDTSCDQMVVASYNIDPVAIVVRSEQIYRFARAEDQEHVGRLDERGQCNVEPFENGRMTLYTGVPYPTEEWPALSFETIGSDRITARVTVLPNGKIQDAESRLDPTAMFEDRGVPCMPVWNGGTLRCLPAHSAEVYWYSPAFADSDCTRPAMSMASVAPIPEVLTMRDGMTGAEQGFLPAGHVLRVGEQLDPDTVYERSISTGRCEHMVGIYGARYFALGEEVPADSYPELRLE